MRKDISVTDQENVLTDKDVIISRTDKKGVITYVSRDFARISEYPVEEMVGKPHNIIRHPDMPAVVFGELWDTIQAGLPWTGIVKNRARSGNFYWVDATVTPIKEANVITGYMSVRKKPDPAAVQQAAALYKAIHDGASYKRKKPAFRRGFVRVILSILALGLPFGVVSLQAMQIIGMTEFLVLCAVQTLFFGLSVFTVYRLYYNTTVSLKSTIDLVSGNLIGAQQAQDANEGEAKLMLLALKSLSITLWGIVSQIQRTAKEAGTTADLLVASSNLFSDSAETLASSVEESAATMEELTGAIEQISHNVSNYSNTMMQVSGVIRALNENLVKTMKSVENLGGLAAEAAEKATMGEQLIGGTVEGMKEISESSQRIGEIVGIITDISEKTNLLALNASIEAARAGDSGRGFAVVAQEISKLSDQTAESVKRISDYVDSTSGAVERGSHQVDRAVAEVRTILDMVNKINETAASVHAAVSAQSAQATRVRQDIEQLLTHGKEIDRAVMEHKEASHSVTVALTQMASQTQTVATEAGHVREASQKVAEHPAYLAGLVDHYRIGNND